MRRPTESAVKDDSGLAELGTFWWAFGLRGGFAVLFAALLGYAGNLFGTAFFDPIMLVMLAVLLGFYVLGNALLLGVAAGFAKQHRDRIWKILAGESAFSAVLGLYIAFTLLLSKESLALLAGLHALGTACFLMILTIRVGTQKTFAILLPVAALAAVYVGQMFLLHREMEARALTHWLAAFELVYGCVIVFLAVNLYREHKQNISGVSPIAVPASAPALA